MKFARSPLLRPPLSKAHTDPGSAKAQRALRRGRFKLIEDIETDRRELYDLADDPAETKDLAAERPALVAELDAHMDHFFELHPDPDAGIVVEMDPRISEHLRSLGYME